MTENDPVSIDTCEARREDITNQINRLTDRVDRVETDLKICHEDFTNALKDSQKEALDFVAKELKEAKDRADKDDRMRFSNLKAWVAGAVAVSTLFIVILDYIIKLFVK